MAVRIRSRLSFTAGSGMPTIVVAANPRDATFTSTSQRTASIPVSVTLLSLASIAGESRSNRILEQDRRRLWADKWVRHTWGGVALVRVLAYQWRMLNGSHTWSGLRQPRVSR